MDLPTMNRVEPQTGTVDEWNAAYYRLEDYLRAHQVTNKVHQSQIILKLLQHAAAKHALVQDKSPTQLAMEEAYALMDGWFERLLPDEPPPRAPMVGRVGLSLIDATTRWPNVFLADDLEIPPELTAVLRQVMVQSGPDLRVSSMVPRPPDAESEEPLQPEPWDNVGRLSVAVLVGSMVLLLAGTLLYLFH
jgi:hypothetical protein